MGSFDSKSLDKYQSEFWEKSAGRWAWLWSKLSLFIIKTFIKEVLSKWSHVLERGLSGKQSSDEQDIQDWQGYRRNFTDKNNVRNIIVNYFCEGENCGAEAGDAVFAASVFLERQVPVLLLGELQYLRRGVRKEVRSEATEEEETRQPGGGILCSSTSHTSHNSTNI